MSKETPNSKPPKYYHSSQYSLGSIDFQLLTPPLSQNHRKPLIMGHYKSPESSRNSSPHPETRRRSQHFGSFTSSSNFKQSKSDNRVGELQIMKYRLEKQVQKLKTKLVQRNQECLDLRAVKEILESKVDQLLKKTRSVSHTALEQQIQKKNQEVHFLKNQIKTMQKSFQNRHLQQSDEQTSHCIQVRHNYFTGKINPEIQQIVNDFSHSNQQSKLSAGIQNSKQYRELQEGFLQLEGFLRSLMVENAELKAELLLYKKQREELGGIVQFSKELARIRKQMKQLKVILESLRTEKEMSLKLVLGLEDPDYSNLTASEQASLDIKEIKEDLQYSRKLIAEFHAEQCGGQACIQQ